MKTRSWLPSLMLMAYACAAPATEIVVIVHPKNPTTKMAGALAAQFFVGKSTALMPIDQADGTALRNEFYQKVAGKDSSQIKAIWSKIVFAGQGLPPTEVASSEEVKKAVAANPLAIGYIEKATLDATVKAILIVP